nr:cytochrome P450 71A3-like [Ipomoea trifida]
MNISVYYYLFPLFISILFLSRFLFSPRRDRKNLPPSPPKLPLLGNILQLGSHPHRSLQKLSTHYGPLMLLHFGSVPVLIASSPDAARAIMKDHDLVFSDRPASSMANRLLYGSKDVAFAPYGEYWRQVRSICVRHLLSNTRVQSFRNVREEETELMVQKIRQSCGSVMNLSNVFFELTNDIVCRVALGRKYGRKGGNNGEKDFKFLVAEFLELLGTFNVGDYIPWLAWVNKINGLDRRVEKVAKDLDEFIDGVVEEHIGLKKEEGDGLDFVDILLDIQRENKIGFPIHRDTDMFLAGTHTVSTLLEWIMTELIKNPKVMKKLSSEVRTLKTSDDLETMQYLKAVIKETLRLHPPIPLLVPRRAFHDVKVMDFHVATGTQVIVNSWAIGRDPIVWENPEKFKPERFLYSNVDYKGMHFELIPFGAGRRGCPGVAFTANMIELALARLVHEFDFASTEDDLDMSEGIGLTANKKIPLTVIAPPRVG